MTKRYFITFSYNSPNPNSMRLDSSTIIDLTEEQTKAISIVSEAIAKLCGIERSGSITINTMNTI